MDSYFYVGWESILHILEGKSISLDSMEKFISYASNDISFPIGIEKHVVTSYDFSIPMMFLSYKPKEA